jgi:DNA-binding GntR family transcriptional regulator
MTFKASDSLAEQIAQHLAERIIRGELQAGERIQEIRVTEALNVSRGSVREALLILQRRHLVEIHPRRGAQVASLTAENVHSLYQLMSELYILLANGVVDNWRDRHDLAPLQAIQTRLQDCEQRGDIVGFVEGSSAAMRATYPFANNGYLQQTMENLWPAVSRTYHMVLEQRRSRMGQFLQTLVALLEAVIARDKARVRATLSDYCQQGCQLVVATLGPR